jgi:hypothetical protein
VKKRSLDMAPGVKNVGLAMTDQMRELLSREHVEIAIKQIMDQMGETEVSLRQRFAQAARGRAASTPALDFEGHLQQLINEQYTLFNPDTAGYTWGSPYLKRLASDRIYIPKHVARNLKGLAEPKRLLGGLMDPITNTFRAAPRPCPCVPSSTTWWATLSPRKWPALVPPFAPSVRSVSGCVIRTSFLIHSRK